MVDELNVTFCNYAVSIFCNRSKSRVCFTLKFEECAHLFLSVTISEDGGVTNIEDVQIEERPCLPSRIFDDVLCLLLCVGVP